ncbi:MAG: thiamine-phosphate kinase [Longimicrobiales bacterium]
MRTSALGPGREFDLIRSFLSALPTHEAVLLGVGDDAALVRGGWVLTTDASVEDVHFRRSWLAPEEIGYRAAAVALSDLAAMAAVPVALLVTLVLTADDYHDVGARIMRGVAQAAARYGAAIPGGDTTRSEGPLVIDIAALGQSDRPVLRSGAQVGDEVWVTGTLGAAAAAVSAWRAGIPLDQAARAAFAQPQPRLAEAQWLANRVILHALIDISDGLASDAAHLAAASNVALHIQTQDVPVHPAARMGHEPAHRALTGGDDYELCFTAAAGSVQPVRAAFQQTFGIALTCIGDVREGSGLALVDHRGQPVNTELKGYDHFPGAS